MSHALAANTSVEQEVISAYCLVQARRTVFELRETYPAEGEVVLEAVGKVYQSEAEAAGLSQAQRLADHREQSGPVMKGLKQWMEAQFSEREMEPNSSLGKARRYWLKHWDKLTLWLREVGTPLDNNEAERALSAIHCAAEELAVLHNRARGRGRGSPGFADPDVPTERDPGLGLPGTDHSPEGRCAAESASLFAVELLGG
jgi:hypothetical protein